MKARTTTSLSITQLVVGLLSLVLATIVAATFGVTGILIGAVRSRTVATVRAAHSTPSREQTQDVRPFLTGLLT